MVSFNYINDIIRSGMAEEATLVKYDYDLNEWGDPKNEEYPEYDFLTVVDSLDRAENEQDAGDFIEGELRFYVSSDSSLDFEHGDIIKYDGRSYNITAINTKTLGNQAKHKEVIVETI